MAFTKEDGTGVTGANAYIDDTEYTTHHTDRGRTVSDSATVIKAAIVRATDYVEKRWGLRFLGDPSTSTQGLHFPAINAWDRHGRQILLVPDQMQKAVAEYALVAIAIGVLAPPLPHGAKPETIAGVKGTAGKGEVIQERVEGAVERRYKAIRPDGSWFLSPFPAIPEADAWLSELVEPQPAEFLRA